MKWRSLVAFLECLMVARPPGSSSISLDCSIFVCSDDEAHVGFQLCICIGVLGSDYCMDGCCSFLFLDFVVVNGYRNLNLTAKLAMP